MGETGEDWRRGAHRVVLTERTLRGAGDKRREERRTVTSGQWVLCNGTSSCANRSTSCPLAAAVIPANYQPLRQVLA